MTRPPGRALRGFSLAGAIAVALLVVGIEIASAESEGEPIRLEYRAGPGCPDQSAFLTRIRARTARARLARDGEPARTFKVELVAGSPPSGSVTLMDGSRSEGTRRLDADTCDEVADALALMVALALDPHAQRTHDGPGENPGPSGAGGGTSTPATEAASDASALEASAPDAAAPGASTLDASAPDSSEPEASAFDSPVLSPSSLTPASVAPASPRPPPHFFAGVDVALATDVTPRLLVAGAPYVGYRSTRPALLGPSIRASFLRAGTGTLPAKGGAADYTWTVGRLDGCALFWPQGPLRIGACARAEAGVLDVQGEQIVPALTQHSPWVAAAALARLEWSFLGPFLLDASAGSSFRIIAKRFVFLPDSTLVYEVPVAGFFAEAGVGVHFL